MAGRGLGAAAASWRRRLWTLCGGSYENSRLRQGVSGLACGLPNNLKTREWPWACREPGSRAGCALVLPGPLIPGCTLFLVFRELGTSCTWIAPVINLLPQPRPLNPLGGSSSPLLPCSHGFVASWGASSPIPKARSSVDSCCSVSHCQPAQSNWGFLLLPFPPFSVVKSLKFLLL